MRIAGFPSGFLITVLLAVLLPASPKFHSVLSAQSQGSPTDTSDPLARIRAEAQVNATACSATGESLCEQVAPKIIANAQGESPLAENLRRFAEALGNREAASTPDQQGARVVAWAAAGFRHAGLDVRTEKYSAPVTWSEGVSRLEILSPTQISVRAISVGWSPPTPPGGLDAPLVFAGNGTDADFARLGSSAKGAILLIHTKPFTSWNELAAEYSQTPGLIRRGTAAGAVAILWMSVRERDLMYRPVNTLTGQLDLLPQAIIPRGDALQFERVLVAGQKIRARLDLPNHVSGSTEHENVVAEIRGREFPDEWIVLGASLGSDELRGGALRRGCNAALVVEAARDILITGIRPRRSIRFILFTETEQGMLGSQAYVKAHRAEMDRVRASIIFGEGVAGDCTGPVTGFSLGGRTDIRAGVLDAVKSATVLGAGAYTLDAPLGDDNFDFLLAGVPTLLANHDETNHTPGDRVTSAALDPVGLASLKRNVAIAAVTAFGIAERSLPIGPRQTRAEIDALLKMFGLDIQMKDAGIWKSWETGERGR